MQSQQEATYEQKYPSLNAIELQRLIKAEVSNDIPEFRHWEKVNRSRQVKKGMRGR